MKYAVVGLTIATVLVAALATASTADAGRYRKHYRHGAHHEHSGYYENRLAAHRFGSKRWWEVYDRQRGRR